MALPTADPTFEGIPAELRVKIYKNLFSNLTLDTSFTEPGCNHYSKLKYESNMPPYLAATTIIRANKAIRGEALAVLEDELTLILNYEDTSGLERAKKFWPRAKKVRVRDHDTVLEGAKTFRRYLPMVEHITYVRFGTHWWNNVLECRTWEDLFAILKGEKDLLLVRQFFSYVNTYAPGWLPSTAVLPGQSPCTIVFEFPTLMLHWSDSDWTSELSNLYRLDIDVTTRRCVHRAVNLGYDTSEADEWVPASDVFILNDGLKRPALFRPENGEIRALLAQKTDDFFDKPSSSYDFDPQLAFKEEAPLDYEKREKYINHEETDIMAIREVERQLLNEKDLQRALATAVRCVPTKDMVDLDTAFSALTVSKGR